MDNVEIRLVTNSQQAVKGLREVGAESQKLHDNTEKQQKKQIGLIADIEKEFTKLRKAQDNKVTVQQLNEYNKKLAEAKKLVEENSEVVTKGNKKVEKSLEGIIGKIGKMAIAYLTVNTAIKVLKETALAFFTKSEQGVELLERKISGLKAAVGVLQGEFIKLGKSMFGGNNDSPIKWGTIMEKTMKGVAFAFGLIPAAIALALPAIGDMGKKMNDAAAAAENFTRSQQELIKAEIAMLVPRAKATAEIIKARKAYTDDTKSAVERIYALEKAHDIENEQAEKEIKNQQYITLSLRNRNYELDKRGQLLDSQSEELQRSMAREIELQTESDQRQIKGLNEIMSLKKEMLNTNKKLNEYYEQSNINALTLEIEALTMENKGVFYSERVKYEIEKLKAIREIGFRQIEEIRKEVLRINGVVTKEQELLFTKLGENVWKAYFKGMESVIKVPKSQADAISKALKSAMPAAAGLRENKAFIGKPTEEFSIWDMLGFDMDSDESEEQINELKKAAEEVFKIIDSTYQKRVEDTQRTRELLDTKISEAQNALEAEIELNRSGYASNVAAKQKEIDDLKAQRERALKDEEKALKAQRSMDALQQTSSLLTASANIIKGFSTLPIIGQILAISAIGAMFAAFANARAQASKMTKLAAGGRGEITGRLHSEGGERFTDHIEVEQGERWGVLNRSASRKYGTVFNKMVDSFNKDKLPVPREVTNILVQNEGPNKRLDEVNSNLRQIRSKEEIIVLNGMTIYKKGNSMRVIKK